MDDLSERKTRFCERIRRRIHAAGLSLAKVDRRLGWSTGYLSQILNEHNSFRVEHLFQISEVLGVSPGELFDEPEPTRAAPLDEVLPGGLRLGDFMDLLEREVEKAVTARLPPKEDDPDGEDAEEEPEGSD